MFATNLYEVSPSEGIVLIVAWHNNLESHSTRNSNLSLFRSQMPTARKQHSCKTIAFQSCFIMLLYGRTLCSKTCICCAQMLFYKQPLIMLSEMLLTWQQSECEGHANYVKECNSFFSCDCHASSPFLCIQTLFFVRSC